jgi:hypothetical protein
MCGSECVVSACACACVRSEAVVCACLGARMCAYVYVSMLGCMYVRICVGECICVVDETVVCGVVRRVRMCALGSTDVARTHTC